MSFAVLVFSLLNIVQFAKGKQVVGLDSRTSDITFSPAHLLGVVSRFYILVKQISGFAVLW